VPSRAALTADRLIRKNGRPVQLRYFDGSSAPNDPAKPWRLGTPEYQFLPTVAVFLDTQTADLLARVSAVSRLMLSPTEVDKTLALIPGTVSIVPEINMTLVDTMQTWEIKRVEKIEPGADGPALFLLMLGN